MDGRVNKMTAWEKGKTLWQTEQIKQTEDNSQECNGKLCGLKIRKTQQQQGK